MKDKVVVELPEFQLENYPISNIYQTNDFSQKTIFASANTKTVLSYHVSFYQLLYKILIDWWIGISKAIWYPSPSACLKNEVFKFMNKKEVDGSVRNESYNILKRMKKKIDSATKGHSLRGY